MKLHLQTSKLENDTRPREFFFKMVILLLFLLLLGRLFYLQSVKGNEFKFLSEQNQYKTITLKALRGQIYDSNGTLIVTNGTGYRLLYLNERDLSDKYVDVIVEATGFNKDFIIKKIKYGEITPYTRENTLIEDLDYSIAWKIMEKTSDFPFLEVQSYSKRKYILDNVAAHSIGYVKKISQKEYEKLKDEDYSPRDIVGKDGLEKQYESYLKGVDGYKNIEVNAFNKLQRIIKDKKPIPGKNIHLTLDMELQQYMEGKFREDSRVGSFIAMNAKTGEIITIVSYPTYSLNMFSSQISPEDWDAILNDPQKPLTNKSIAGEYPPGSVFKVVSALAFLDSGIDPKKKYLDNKGYYSIGKWKWRAWKRGGHGQVDMRKSIIESANPYYYRLSDEIGNVPISESSKLLGLGSKTGIDIPGEKSGIVPEPEWKEKRFNERWYKGDTILMSIGQGYSLVTPIQILKTYAIIANKGTIYSPHLVSKVEDPTTGEIIPITGEKITIDRFPEAYYNILHDALIATVNEPNGTTKTLRNPYFKVAAKSGSAQHSHSKTTHAWVAGFFPADNPEIVFATILTSAGSGGAVAGQMTKYFLEKYVELKGDTNEQE